MATPRGLPRHNAGDTALDSMVAGERRLLAGGEWYQHVALAIANSVECSLVVGDDGGGRRRGSSGGEVRLLSGEGSGGAPATRRGSGGRGGDGELGGVLHDDAAAQFDGDETRPKTLDGEMRRRKGSGGEMGGGSGIRGCWRSSGSYL